MLNKLKVKNEIKMFKEVYAGQGRINETTVFC